MFASKLKLSEDTSSQKSTVGKILEWMQDHPNQCKNTNATVMAKAMELSKVGPFNSVRQAIQRMVNNQMLFRYGNRKRSNFFINYMHKDIPSYVLDGAPESDKKARERAESGLKKDQYVDEVGCVVTKPKPKKEARKEEPKEEVEEEAEEEPEEENVPSIEDVVEHVAAVPIMVRKEKANGATNISITLNINLNN